VCVIVGLSVRPIISKMIRPNITKIFVRVFCGRASVDPLQAEMRYLLYTSSLSHNGHFRLVALPLSYRRSSHERSYSTFSPVSTGMGDRFGAGIQPRCVTRPTISNQPCIPPGSLNLVPALIGWG